MSLCVYYLCDSGGGVQEILCATQQLKKQFLFYSLGMWKISLHHKLFTDTGRMKMDAICLLYAKNYLSV